MNAHPLTILTGASRGMGLAMAEQLIDAGHALLCISRHPALSLAERASGKGVPLEQWPQDLARGETAAARLETWLQGRSPAVLSSVTLINNAALIAKVAPLEEQSAADIVDAMRVDLEAPLLLTSAFLRATAGWQIPRRILNISSGLARRPMAASALYCAAKAGMDLYSRCVALEQAALPNGARICSLAPGVIDTDMQVQLRTADPAAFPERGNFVSLKEKGALTPPAEAAARVLAWLARADFGADVIADVRG